MGKGYYILYSADTKGVGMFLHQRGRLMYNDTQRHTEYLQQQHLNPTMGMSGSSVERNVEDRHHVIILRVQY